MITLPNKNKCKRKQFIKALKIGHYVYLEFMNHKTCGAVYYQGKLITRDMTPRPKIFKIVSRNKFKLIYFKLNCINNLRN